MVDQKSNAQVLNGVNDDISEMKSLTTLRKRVVTDGEVVSKSQNAFRLAGGKRESSCAMTVMTFMLL